MAFCPNKAEWRRERKNEAISKAQQMANVAREKMAITKEGPLYRIVKLSEANGHNVIEIIIPGSG